MRTILHVTSNNLSRHDELQKIFLDAVTGVTGPIAVTEEDVAVSQIQVDDPAIVVNGFYISRIAYDVGRAFDALNGTYVDPDWDDLSPAMKQALDKQVAFLNQNKTASIDEIFNDWKARMQEIGWTYGSTYRFSDKTHPALCQDSVTDCDPDFVNKLKLVAETIKSALKL